MKFHSMDSHIFLWPCGNSTLGIVDLRTNSYSKIAKLGGTINNLCHTGTSCDNGRKVMTCTFDVKSQSSLLAFWNQTTPDPKDSTVKVIDSREVRNSSQS
jgi:hypothetical protein